MRDTNINYIPDNIPEAQKKEGLLQEKNIEYAYAGQGVLFIPPESAIDGYNKYLSSQNLNSKDFPLSVLMAAGSADGDTYNSPTLDKIYEEIRRKSNEDGKRDNVAFQTRTYNKYARDTVGKFFDIDSTQVATIQSNDLQDSLRLIRSIMAILADKPVSRIVLPEKYTYPGYDVDFADEIIRNNPDFEIIRIPEVQENGTQDLEAMEANFKTIKESGRVAFVVDQPHNNNSSGYDRDPSLNEDLVKLFKKYEGVVFYVGDVAYKGLKEGLNEPYPLMQEFISQDVNSIWCFSPSKIGNYRAEPSFMNTVFATAGSFANVKKLEEAFKKSERGAGIGVTDEGAKLMQKLAISPEFKKEVDVLSLYLAYIRNALGKSECSGMFFNVTEEEAIKMNSGHIQVITVGTRIAIGKFGDPQLIETYNQSKGG